MLYIVCYMSNYIAHLYMLLKWLYYMVNNNAVGRRFATALLPRLFGMNPRSHHKGATGRVRTGDQRLPVLCHCHLDKTSPYIMLFNIKFTNILSADYTILTRIHNDTYHVIFV